MFSESVKCKNKSFASFGSPLALTLSDPHPQEEEEEEECEERPGARSHGAVCVRDPETDEVSEESCDHDDHDDHDRLVS